MADEQAVADEVIEATEENESEEVVESADEDSGIEEETVITLAGESPTPEDEEQESAPEWVKGLRKQNREQAKELRRIKSELDAAKAQPTETKPVELGPKPRLGDDDVDYDEDKLVEKLDKWHERKREIESVKAKEKEAHDNAQAAWNERLKEYEAKKAALKVHDFEDAEDAAKEALSVIQQSIIVDSANDPAVVTYVLGKNPKKAKELAAIANPLKFARAIWELEKEGIEVTTRTSKPKAEGTVRGTASVQSGTTNLDRLREQAQKSGDWTAYLDAKRAKTKPK